MKPEFQRYRTVAGKEEPLPCHECEAKAIAALRSIKPKVYKHSKAISEARKKQP
jgi:hypothetical protein